MRSHIRQHALRPRAGVPGDDDLSETYARCELQIAEALNRLLDDRADENGAWSQGELQVRHSHLSRVAHGALHKCGCASRS
ncbi:hypothetical protein V8O11_14475 [Erwinia aphidicola]|uniref:hypothetical protein n=1 Tax=Erwinia TaxID=551 RepID=UPI0010614D30|nr:hypothetical protein [Erwinia aphidicola]MCP2231051.1 hypothetical protein [Erwinia aphidicola]